MTDALEGYSHLEWPDLSANRSPLSGAQITSTEISLPPLDSTICVADIVLAAISRLVGTYCGVTDICLALQVAQAQSIGIVRVSWREEESWDQIIARISNGVAHARAHPTSFSEAKKTLSLSANQYPCMALILFDEDVSSLQIEYPVVFSYTSANSLLQLSASMTVIHPSVAKQIVSQVGEIVLHALADPTSKIASISFQQSHLMSACERGTDEEVASAYPQVPRVAFAPDYLALRASDSPARKAVCWYSDISLDDEEQHFESLSYLEFHVKANQVARWLLRQGLQLEDRVAVCLDRNLEYHTAVFGIMRAGGCYVPIDPELPLERKIYIAKDANAKFVLTSARIASIDVFGSSTCYFDDKLTQQQISQELTDNINCMKKAGLAYLLYTSGTTGNPKGCLLTHHGLSEAVLALSSAAADVRMNDIREGRYLAVASIAFDVHLAETLIPVALGMTLLSARRSQLFENLPAFVNKLGITHLGIVPSLIEATLNAATNGSDIALRYIASGGEKMSDAILDKWADHPQVRLANFYGPSEVTIGCCARSMTSATPRANIGRAFANVSSYVVDANMNVVIRGGVGELVVEGPLVGRGYHGRDDLTAKVFVEWPEKGRWAYRTGDLVRMMPDSTLEILGRIDTQIKLRGVRIESEGISAIVRNTVPSSAAYSLDVTTILAKHPGINVDQLISIISWDKTVSIATRKSKKPHLVPPPAGLLQEIRMKCETELPGYMRPSHVLPLSWLPLSSNGKTDEKILAQIFKDMDVEVLANITMDEGSTDSRPCTEMELSVFEALQKCISIPITSPRPDLNVFECGLDSMSAIRLSSFLRDSLKMEISASEIMKKPRLSDIASFTVGERNASEQELSTDRAAFLQDSDFPYAASHVEDILPPFTVQEGVLARSADEDSLYVQHVLVSCHASTILSKLHQAWKNVVRRQQILRTVFHFGRSLSQVVLSPDHCDLQWTNEAFSSSNPDTFKKFFLTQRSVNLSKDINQNISDVPAYRVSSFTAPDCVFMALSIHHSLFDGIALPCLILEVEREYLGLQPEPVAPATEILRQIAKIDRDQARAFWKFHFEGFKWPQHLSINSELSSDSYHHNVSFKSPLSIVKALASSQRITLQALLTGAFAILAGRDLYQSKDVAFGILRSGRLLPVSSIESAIYPLLSVIPTRVNFNDGKNTLHSIQEGISSMVEYEHLPLGNIQSWIRPGYPLFDTLFSVSVAPESSSEIWSIIDSEPPHPDYPLAVEVVVDHGKNSLRVQAAWKVKKQSDVFLKMLQEFENVVHDLGTNPTECMIQYFSKINASSASDAPATDTRVSAVESSETVDPTIISGLRSIIADFLQVNPAVLTPAMSFVSMGLDSIKSVGLARLLSKNGFPVNSTELLQNSNLSSLAKCITLRPQTSKDRGVVYGNTVAHIDAGVVADIRSQNKIELTDEDIVSYYPTTALQTGMLSQTINTGGKLYVHAFPMVISGELDTRLLFEAWKTAIHNFPILRTTFHFAADSGIWVQALHTAETLDWEEIPLRSSQEYASALSSFFSTIVLDEETSFATPPLWVRLFKPAVGEATLVFAMHHALYDGISIGLLTKSIEEIYKGTFQHENIQFFDVLPLILAQERGGTAFWTNKLRSFRPGPLVPRHTPQDNISITVEREFFLDREDVSNLLLRAAVTMQCVCQAAWGKVLTKYTGASDVVFGHTLAGRSIPGAEFVIGPTLNTIPCCIRIADGARNIDLLKTIHQANLEALPWQHASVRAIQKSLQAPNLWDSLFLFQSSAGAVDDTASMWKFDEISSNQGVHIQYPLNVEILHTDAGVRFKCASQPSFMDQAELDALGDDLTNYIKEIVKDPYGVSWASSSKPSQPHEATPASTIDLPAADTAESLLSIYGTMIASLANVPISLIKTETPLAALGVDSITAIQIVSKFRQLGLKVTTGDILNSRTIGDMLNKTSASKKIPKHSPPPKSITPNVKHDARSQPDDAPDSVYTITDKEKLAIYEGLNIPAKTIESISIPSPGMKWLIGAWQRSHKTRFQHVFPFQLSENIDKPQMRAAWFSLVQRHAILRSTFSCMPGQQEPRLITFKNPEADSWVEEHTAESSFYGSLMARMKTMVANPPPLEKSQARALLFSSRRHSYLILHLHHFQYDAWSLQSLLHDLSQTYLKKKTMVSNDLNSFLKYCALTTDTLEQQRQYWKSSFPSNFTPALFPTLNPKAGSMRRIDRLIRTKMACIANASHMEERARARGVSLQSVFLAVWSMIQADMTGGSSSTFGLWQSGRTGGLDDIANIAVPCMNVLPMHVSDLATKKAVDVAQSIQTDLYKRSSTVEQTDLIRVGDWIGAGKVPLCNVFLNIVKVASDVKDDGLVLKFAHAPYYVPSEVTATDGSTHQFDVTKVIQDDLFIDIATISKSDSIMMSIDAAAHLLNEDQADALIARWALDVEKVLGVSL